MASLSPAAITGLCGFGLAAVGQEAVSIWLRIDRKRRGIGSWRELLISPNAILKDDIKFQNMSLPWIAMRTIRVAGFVGIVSLVFCVAK